MKRRRLFTIIACLLTVITIRAPITAHAETATVFSADAKGTLTLRYFDDENDKAPVEGTEFDVYQVSYIGRSTSENGMYVPLAPGMDFSKQANEDSNAYAQVVEQAYKKNPELGYTAHIKTDESGIAKTTDMPVGAYLVCETKAARYHIKTIPFLISVPQMNDQGTAWNFDVVSEPKASIAGDLKISKKITGNSPLNSHDTFSFKIRMADGEYHAKDAKGQDMTVQDGSVIRLKGGQSFTIYDLPDKSDFRVTELGANQDGYTTTYSNRTGQIVGKQEVDTVVTNKRNKPTIASVTKAVTHNIATGVRGNRALLYILIGASTTLIVFLLLTLKRKEHSGQPPTILKDRGL